MLPRSSTPPTGPRGASPGGRGVGRGGIQKRRNGPLTTDRDGDLLMEPVGDNEVEGMPRGRAESGRMRARASGLAGHAAGTSRGGFSTQQAQQAIIRGLGLQQANILESSMGQYPLPEHGYNRGTSRRSDQESFQAYLRVHGLKESKAASNPDGGVKDLLGFLERKANGVGSEARSGVRIKKVCLSSMAVIVSVSCDPPLVTLFVPNSIKGRTKTT
jgi:nuclear RNA export factor